ncbi:MAG: type II toxin-antitoxin system HicB family antitoxin [Verrucomicrobia bacterium]|nr:type II toxin-antitoxin system HicB family antitoxin [Verrucomicrobiota bacterium]
MKIDYTAIVKQDGDWWIGWVEEVPGVNAQERTKEELMNSLREALREAIELNREDARSAAHGDFVEEPLVL